MSATQDTEALWGSVVGVPGVHSSERIRDELLAIERARAAELERQLEIAVRECGLVERHHVVRKR